MEDRDIIGRKPLNKSKKPSQEDAVEHHNVTSTLTCGSLMRAESTWDDAAPRDQRIDRVPNAQRMPKKPNHHHSPALETQAGLAYLSAEPHCLSQKESADQYFRIPGLVATTLGVMATT